MPRLTLHELRHTFITRCHEKKIDEIVIQKWVGQPKRIENENQTQLILLRGILGLYRIGSLTATNRYWKGKRDVPKRWIHEPWTPLKKDVNEYKIFQVKPTHKYRTGISYRGKEIQLFDKTVDGLRAKLQTTVDELLAKEKEMFPDHFDD